MFLNMLVPSSFNRVNHQGFSDIYDHLNYSDPSFQFSGVLKVFNHCNQLIELSKGLTHEAASVAPDVITEIGSFADDLDEVGRTAVAILLLCPESHLEQQPLLAGLSP